MLVVNLFGGPGSGKSTMASGIFHKLKTKGVNCELVFEQAKNFTLEKRHITLSCQPYIFAKQMRDIWRLRDQVDVAIVDSPLLLSCIYGDRNKWPESFFQYAIDQFNAFDNLNYRLLRKTDYIEVGRNETEEEAVKIDLEILNLLLRHNVFFDTIDPDKESLENLAEQIENYSKNLKKGLTNAPTGV